MLSPSDKFLLNLNEVGELISYHPQTLRNLISKGELPFPYVKQGRKVLVARADLERWVKSLTRIRGTGDGGHQ